MSKRIKWIMALYFLVAFLVIFLSNKFSEPQATILTIRNLGITDVFHIFINNLTFASFAYLMSFTGLSLILVFKIFFLIGQGPSQAGLDSGIYYLSSVSHGLGELFIGGLIFYFTFQHIRTLYSFFLGKILLEDIKIFYKNFFKYILPITILIIFVSAFAEVYISNKVIAFFHN